MFSAVRARWQAVRPDRRDLLLAAALTIVGELEAWLDAVGHGNRPVSAVATLVVCGVVAVRRIAPLAAVIAVNVAILVQAALGGFVLQHGFATVLAVVIVIYSLGAYADGVALRAGVAVQATGLVVGGIAFGDASSAGARASTILFGLAIGCAVPVAAGVAMRNRRRLVDELHHRTDELVAQREHSIRAAAAAERARIAGELHDVVSHNVSVMVVQAGAARRLMARDPDRASEAMMAIESTGRAALDEMRRLLGVLRRGDEDLALAPQPTLRRVDALIERARRNGLDAALRVEGTVVELPLGLDVAAYRIVQAALKSAQAHAPGAHAEVVVRYGRSDLELEVVNSAAADPDPGAKPASGLVGLRERVALFGGDLHAGRRRGGGYALRARLPLVEMHS